MDLNYQRIKMAKSKSDSKSKLTVEDEDLVREVLVLENKELRYITDNCNVYETCLWLESKNNLLANKNKRNISRLKSKEIVMVDLGSDMAMNFHMNILA